MDYDFSKLTHNEECLLSFPGVHRNRNAWAVRFDFMGAPVYFGTHRDLATARRIAATEILKLKGDFLPAETRALLQKEVQP